MILSHHARVLQLFGYLPIWPTFKKIFQKSVIFIFFSFDLCTDIILKQLNKIKNMFFCFFVFFSLFVFLCCFPFCFPVVLPYCIPRCVFRLRAGTGSRGTGSKSSGQPLRLSANARARWRKGRLEDFGPTTG